jgi:hypothetical protein
MPSDQLKHLKLAVVDLLSFTGIERIYDPESITIREEFKDTGNDMYKPYQLLTQPQEVESQSIKIS